MKNLDDLSSMKKLDPSGVLESTALYQDQCLAAWKEASSMKFSKEYRSVKNVVVCGMGGSRFTPKTVKELYRNDITVPYEIIEDYTLPGYVNTYSLVILSSYSGSTEEILSCGQEAIKRNAKLTGIMKGGKIADFLKNSNRFVYLFDAKYNPCGQPRIGGGYLLFGHIGMLSALGLLKVKLSDIYESIEFARQYAKTCVAEVREKHNQAKQLARSLYDTHPFIITSEFLRGFGNGFANQINETAKMISDYRYIPELNHHLMEGLKHPDVIHKSVLFVFILSSLYSPQVIKRYKITKEVVKKQNIRTLDISLSGKTKLSQTLEAFILSGFTTYYLAMLYDTDPVAIPWVDYFKDQLAK